MTIFKTRTGLKKDLSSANERIAFLEGRVKDLRESNFKFLLELEGKSRTFSFLWDELGLALDGEGSLNLPRRLGPVKR